MKKLALGAVAGVALAYVIKPWERWRRGGGDDSWQSDLGRSYTTPDTTSTQPGTAAADMVTPSPATAAPPPDPAAPVDPDELTSPGTVDDPDLEAQRAREAAERERESRLSDETKFDELRDMEQERDTSQIVGDVPEPRED